MNKEIANTIWNQMNTIDKSLVWAMGTSKPTIIESGLQFNVKGLTFKGTVQVILDQGNDTYVVKFIKNKRVRCEMAKSLGVTKYNTHLETVGEFKEVYVETLMPLLDNYVELNKAV